MRGLTELERCCFVLKHIEQWRLIEIADELKISQDSIKQALFRALRKLRGDGIQNEMNDPWASYTGNFHSASTASRSMVTAGLEARYPVLITAPNSSHVFEPIVQVALGALVSSTHAALSCDDVEVIEREGEFEIIARGQTLQVGSGITYQGYGTISDSSVAPIINNEIHKDDDYLPDCISVMVKATVLL